MSNANSEIQFVIFLGGVLGLAFVTFLFYITYKYTKRQQQFQKEIADMRLGLEQRINEAQLEMQEETLSQIADKLHDEIKNSLNACKLMLVTLARQTKEDYTKETLNEIVVEMGKVINEIRFTSHSLKSDRVVNIGLAEAIQFETYLLKKSSNIEISIEKETSDNVLLEEKHTVYLFRMFQEIMGNVIAHSRASRVLIKLLTPSENKFVMSVVDNGVGFNVKEARKKSSGSDGIGLTGLYKRAFQINADLDIQSGIGLGTTVKIELPLS
ncbi:MAG: hypothetical protein J0I09_05425 [Sphingobacteriia bacterium]|nr:hypothetical protein [Sphingobacteriia bacterium]